MRYEVPQFIEEETKIIGPLSFRQFFLFLAGVVFSFILFFIFKPWLWFIFSVLLFGIMAVLAFGKYQGRPLSAIFFNIFRFFWQPRRAVWKKEALKAEGLYKKEPPESRPPPVQPKKTADLTPEKIKELAKKLDQPKNG